MLEVVDCKCRFHTSLKTLDMYLFTDIPHLNGDDQNPSLGSLTLLKIPHIGSHGGNDS